MLIDYENVQPDILGILDRENFKVIVFVGSNQAKVRFDFASVLQQMGDRAQYIKISGSGPNSLDFHIAFYIGQISEKEPDTFFHIVSKDTGFDPLIKHLKSKKIFANRSVDVKDIPIIKSTTKTSTQDRFSIVLQDLKRRGSARPGTIKKLTSTIHVLFHNLITEADVENIIIEMKNKNILEVNGTKCSYSVSD